MTTSRLLALALWTWVFTPISAAAQDATLKAAEQPPGVAQQQPVELFEESLARIVLQREPTRDQCRAYLAALNKLAGDNGLTIYSYVREYDLITDRLKNNFPAEHFDLLASEVVNTTRISRAADRTLSAMDLEPAVIKKGILANLERDPTLIRVVLANGWSEDARPSILKALRAEGPLPTPDWFVAAVELNDPKLYKQLHERTIRSPYAVDYIHALEALAGYDLANTTRVAYQRSKEGLLKLESGSLTSYPRKRLCTLAATNGNIDALADLVNALDADGKQFSASTDDFYTSSRMSVLKLIDFRGDNAAIKSWFEQNRDGLIFDQFTKRYVVADDEF
ncbi:MAG: hypothetical protein ACE37H_18555 [Phycisphaeraceae bacterium]